MTAIGYILSTVPRIVTAPGSVTMYMEDTIVEINKTISEVTAVTSPPINQIGKIFTLKDAKGDSNTYPITLTPSFGLIDGQPNFVINVSYRSISFYWNGTDWRII